MKLYFMLARRQPPVPSQIVLEVSELLKRCGIHVESGVAEEILSRPDQMAPAHDLYLLKSYTPLSLSLAGVLHGEGARLLNPYPGCVAARNKIVAAQRLRAAAIPAPCGWVTNDLALLRPIVEHMPLILKPYMGWRGEGVRIVRNPQELAAVPAPVEPLLVQEYVEGSGEDLRLYIAGEEVFAVRKPFSSTSFAHPGRPCAVTAEMREIGLRCGRAFGLGLYGVDLIESKDGLMVIDVNYFPGFKGVLRAAPVVAEYIEGYAAGRYSLRLPEPLPVSVAAQAYGVTGGAQPRPWPASAPGDVPPRRTRRCD